MVGIAEPGRPEGTFCFTLMTMQSSAPGASLHIAGIMRRWALDVWAARYCLGLEIIPNCLGGLIKPTGACSACLTMVMKRNKWYILLFDQYGYFNEEMGRKGNNLASNMEIDFMLRLEKEGVPIYYVPDAEICHLVQRDRLKKSFFFRRFYAQGTSDAHLFSPKTLMGTYSLTNSIHKEIYEEKA